MVHVRSFVTNARDAVQTRRMLIVRPPLVTALALLVLSLTCLPHHELPARPALGWDGGAHDLVWRDGDAIRLRRGNARSTLYTAPDLRSDVELVSGPSGALALFTHGDDRSDETPWPVRRMVVIHLDRDGVAGPPREAPGPYSVDGLCRSSVATARYVVVGYTEVARHHRHIDTHGLIWLSPNGEFYDAVVVGGHVGRCALAAHDNEIAFVASTYGRIVIEFLDLETGSDVAPRIAIEGVAKGEPYWNESVVAFGDGYAVLYRDAGDRLRVARFDRTGILETLDAPAGADAATADLGATSHGLFVTWARGGRIHVEAVGRDGFPFSYRMRGDSPTAALGRDGTCALATSSGRDAYLATFEGCP